MDSALATSSGNSLRTCGHTFSDLKDFGIFMCLKLHVPNFRCRKPCLLLQCVVNHSPSHCLHLLKLGQVWLEHLLVKNEAKEIVEVKTEAKEVQLSPCSLHLCERTHIFPGVSFIIDLLFQALFVTLVQINFDQCFNFPNKIPSCLDNSSVFLPGYFPCFHTLQSINV